MIFRLRELLSVELHVLLLGYGTKRSNFLTIVSSLHVPASGISRESVGNFYVSGMHVTVAMRVCLFSS